MKHTNIHMFTKKSAAENFPGRVRAGTEGGNPLLSDPDMKGILSAGLPLSSLPSTHPPAPPPRRWTGRVVIQA